MTYLPPFFVRGSPTCYLTDSAATMQVPVSPQVSRPLEQIRAKTFVARPSGICRRRACAFTLFVTNAQSASPPLPL